MKQQQPPHCRLRRYGRAVSLACFTLLRSPRPSSTPPPAWPTAFLVVGFLSVLHDDDEGLLTVCVVSCEAINEDEGLLGNRFADGGPTSQQTDTEAW